MNKQLLIGALALVAGGAYLWWPRDASAAEPTPSRDLFTVRRGDLAIAITENGTMVAKESQKVTTKIRSQSKIQFLIEEGKEVPEGEVICKLDTTQAQQSLEQVQLDILQTEANLKTARTELEIQVVENTAAMTKARVALDRAQKEIEKYRDAEAPQERRKLEIALKDAETQFNRDKKNLEDSEKLLEQKFIKLSELEDHQLAFERATVQKESAEVGLRIFDKYTLPMAMTDLESKLADAQRDVGSSEKRGESQLGQKSVNVQQLEKRLKVQNDQLKQRQEDIDNMTLKAPCPGIVLYGDPHEPWYRERVKVGGEVYGGMTLMTIPDLRVMQVKLQVHEADISKLKTGLKATITTDSYPGLRLAGEVSKIATIANAGGDWGGNSSEVKKFDVEVTLDSQPDALAVKMRPGISAKCEIQVETVPATLFVPMQCVFAEDGVHYCHVVAATGAPEKRKVEIGKSNEVYIELLSGINEGDRVLLYNPMLPTVGGDADKTPEEAAPAADGGPPAGAPAEASAAKPAKAGA